MSDDADVTHILWLIYRNAIKKHLDAEAGFASSEAEYREQAEKAGIVAVANFVSKAERAA